MIRNLLWAGAGVVLAWVAIHWWPAGARWDSSGRAVETSAELRAANARVPAPRSAGADVEQPDDPEDLGAAPPPTEIVTAPAPVPAATDAAEPTRLTVVWSPPRDSRPVFTDIPNRRANDDNGSRPATDLLDAGRITCDWGAGNITGARVGDTLSVGSGSQWQGSLMVYDLLGGSTGAADGDRRRCRLANRYGRCSDHDGGLADSPHGLPTEWHLHGDHHLRRA